MVWKVSTQAIAFQQNDYQVDTIAWQPGTHNLARALLFPAKTQVWDIRSQKLLKTYTNVTAFIWSPDGKELASYTPPLSRPGQPANKVAIIDAASGAQVALYRGQHYSINSVSWSLDGRYIATGESSSIGDQILVWIA